MQNQAGKTDLCHFPTDYRIEQARFSNDGFDKLAYSIPLSIYQQNHQVCQHTTVLN